MTFQYEVVDGPEGHLVVRILSGELTRSVLMSEALSGADDALTLIWYAFDIQLSTYEETQMLESIWFKRRRQLQQTSSERAGGFNP